MRRSLLIALWLALAVSPVAHAQPVLLESSPAAETSMPAPSRLVLKFDRRVKVELSFVMLVGGPRSIRVILSLPRGPDTDTLFYALPELAPGQYRAAWKVSSADGHVNEGEVRFTVVESRR